jgi:adenylate kinase
MVAKYGLLHLSSGDILRQYRAEGTGLGKKAQAYMDSGKLVPDGIIIEMMIDRINKSPKGGFVLDGYPRTVNQAVELDKALARSGKGLDAIVNLKVTEDVVLERITGRRSCPKCGAVYHIANLKPKVEGVCDHDGAELVQRPDDTAEVVVNRLKTYHQQTAPVVEYYKAKDSVCDIDANRDADEVKELLFAKLDGLVR